MYPVAASSVSWEKHISAAMCRPPVGVPPTMLPTTCTSNEGNGAGAASSVSDGDWRTKSPQVKVLAGIWMVRLHGTVMVMLLITAVPPKLPGGVPGGQFVPSTVACWRNPSSVNPWMPDGGTENAGSASVGSVNRAAAPGTGRSVPTVTPPPPPGPGAALQSPPPARSTTTLSSATSTGV